MYVLLCGSADCWRGVKWSAPPGPLKTLRHVEDVNCRKPRHFVTSNIISKSFNNYSKPCAGCPSGTK